MYIKEFSNHSVICKNAIISGANYSYENSKNCNYAGYLNFYQEFKLYF